MPADHSYACSSCPRTFKYKNSLSRHRIKAHTSQSYKPAHIDDKCGWCGSQFSAAGLERHLRFHAKCSRLQDIADGKASEPTLSSASGSDSDSDSDTSHFWDEPELVISGERPGALSPSADDMESVHYEGEGEEHNPPPTPPVADRGETPDPGVVLERMLDTEGHEVFVESFPCPHAGQPIRRVQKTHKDRGKYPDVGALLDPEAFEIAELLMRSGVSARFRNCYLRVKRFRNKIPWHNNRALLKDIDKLPHGPDWEVQPFKLTGNSGEEVVELWKRNPLDIIRAILGDKALRKYLHYVPQRHYTAADRLKRRRSELWTADWLWNTQELIDDLFATIISCIVSSDETKLTNFAGNKKAHPVYFTIGNLPKRLRRRISRQTTVLIGYLPVPTLSCETNKDRRRELKRDLFHQCLASILQPLADACKSGVEMDCSDGGVRRIYPVLASYIADFPEQCKVACTKSTHCPLCVCHPKARGEPGDSALRDREDTLRTLQANREGPSARFNWLGLTRIHPDPFWADHPYVDTGTFLTPDLLHQVHKGVMKDHLIKWVTTILGKPTLDERYMTMPEHHGMRHFKHGITSVSQWTGRELKEMTKTLLPAIADSNPLVVNAARALLDFMHLAHLGSITDDDLDAMEDALRTFHNHKAVFQKLGAVTTDKGFHGIPKIHMISHYMHLIRELGTPDGYNTETSERLHIDFAKLGYRASNKVNATKQMALYIQRLEAIDMHAAYLSELAETAGRVPPLPEVEMRSAPNRGRVLDESDDEDEWDPWFEDEGEEDEEDEEDNPEELVDAGVRVQPVVNLEGLTQVEGRPWEEVAPPLGAEDGNDLPTFYPNPQHVLAKTPTATATVSELVLEHGAQRFLEAMNAFVTKELPENQQLAFNNATRLNIWSRARLFHRTPPFQPSEGPCVEVIRAQPAKIDQYRRVSRPRGFDTALLLAFPDRVGIHRYRPGRVRVIFELTHSAHAACPEPLAYVELFNSASTNPVQNLGLFTTTRSLVQQQRASLIVRLSAIRMACHLAPKYNSQEPNTELTAASDSLQIFKTFYINIFSTHLMYQLVRHWVLGISSLITGVPLSVYITVQQVFYHTPNHHLESCIRDMATGMFDPDKYAEVLARYGVREPPRSLSNVMPNPIDGLALDRLALDGPALDATRAEDSSPTPLPRTQVAQSSGPRADTEATPTFGRHCPKLAISNDRD